MKDNNQKQQASGSHEKNAEPRKEPETGRQAKAQNQELPPDAQKAIEDLKHQLEDREKASQEMVDCLQRLQAEFENYRKRIEKDQKEHMQHALEKFFEKLLPVLDSFELCLHNAECSKNHQEFVKGVELIYSQFYAALEDEGLKPIDVKGKEFDPHHHEALLAEPSEKKENTILEELQKGFMFRHKVLRHSKVKVAKKP